MSRSLIENSLKEAQTALNTFLSDNQNIDKIEQAGELMSACLKKGGKLMSCGNGGSMCDAMHFAEELSGQFRESRPALAGLALSDASHITCAANDFGFGHIFSRQVEALGRKGDVLLAISTSGNSANVVNAALTAQKAGMKVVALTGKTGGKLADIADVEIRAPRSAYSDRVQEIHIKAIHILIEYIESKLTPKK